MVKVDNSSYQEDDEIEIVGDTEMDKKNAERVDKNFSKMTLKGQREAMEAFKSSTLYSSEEEEEEDEEVSKGHKNLGTKKRKVTVESDSDSDIEVLESPKPKKPNKSAGEGKVLEEEKERKMSKKTNDSDEKLLKDECDKQKPEYVQVNFICFCIAKQTNSRLYVCLFLYKIVASFSPRNDLVHFQVKSASGKTMLVERSKLQRLMAMESSKVAKIPADKEVTQSSSKFTFKPIEKKSLFPEEILLDDDDDADQKERNDDSLKTRDPVTKSVNEDEPEVGTNEKPVAEKKRTEDESDDPEEILLADDEDDEVTIDNEVVIEGNATSIEVVVDGDATNLDQLQQLKRKHEGEEVESKRMRKTIQG